MRYEINCYILFGWTWGLKQLHNIKSILYTLSKEIKKYVFKSDIFVVQDSSCKSPLHLTWEHIVHKALMTELHNTKSYLYLTIQVMWDMKLCWWASSSWHFEGSNSLHLKGQAVQDWHEDGKLYWSSDTASLSRRHEPSATIALWELLNLLPWVVSEAVHHEHCSLPKHLLLKSVTAFTKCSQVQLFALFQIAGEGDILQTLLYAFCTKYHYIHH